jgi:hypothetical protein
MLKFTLTKKATKAISQIVGNIFARAKKRFLGKELGPKDIRFVSVTKPVEHRLDLSLRGIFEAAAKSEGMTPNEKLYESIEKGVENYFDAHEKLATARVVNAVQSHLHDLETGKVDKDPEKVLKNVLDTVLEKVTSDVKEVVNTEANRAKNYSTLDAITKITAGLGIDDPTVYFSGPVDSHICGECLRLYFLADKVTPRVWKMSELKNGYFKRSDTKPSVASCHPNCRHTLCSVLPGYGFVGGQLTFIEPGYDVWQDQHKL